MTYVYIVLKYNTPVKMFTLPKKGLIIFGSSYIPPFQNFLQICLLVVFTQKSFKMHFLKFWMTLFWFSQELEQRFIGTIAGERSTSIARQNKSAHEKVFETVPISKLETQAKEKFKLLFKEDSKLSLKYMRDLAVYELVQWFKKDFFTWVDKMKCDICAIDMSLIKMDAPNFQENQDGAGRVELYHCLQCSSAKRFPR